MKVVVDLDQHAMHVIVTVEIRSRAEEDDDSEYYGDGKENTISSEAGGENVIRGAE